MTTLIDIRLPHMGSVERAVITAWHKNPGDKVAVDEPLLDVATDKVDTEVPSPQEGTLVQILAQPDQEVPVGELIARLAPIGASADEIAAALGTETLAATSPAASPAAPEAAAPPVLAPVSPVSPATPACSVAPAGPASLENPAAVQRKNLDGLSLVLKDAVQHLAEIAVNGREMPTTSPLVRRIAKEAGIDLRTVTGTGLGGRITRNDLRSHMEAAATPTAEPIRPASPQPIPSAPVTPTVPQPAPSAPQPAGTRPAAGTAPTRPEGYEAIPCEEVALTPVRKAIAAHMVASVSTAPQLTAQVDVDFTRLAAARAEINAERARRGLGKLSYLPFIARALVAAIGENPDINATFTDTHLLQWRTVNLGIAVDADGGLYVPVVRDAQRLSLEGLGEAIADLAARARERRLTTADLQGGTITISNSGSVGGVISTPILTRPQVTSLGVPAVVRQPVAVTAENGEEYVAIRPVARLGLTFDHRAMDGSGALRALIAVQRALQEWSAEAYR